MIFAAWEASMMRNQAIVSERTPASDAAVARKFFELGMRYATGAGASDLMAAHKWFNLAAMHGDKQAGARRIEIAAELSGSEIAAAQRAARDWLMSRAQ
jgi:uncharacterized protein